MEQDYRIAGLSVRMDSFGRTVRQAEKYLHKLDGKPDIVICSEARALQTRLPKLSLDDCEYLSTGASFYRQLLNFDGMMIHASAIAMDGYAYLFSAPSGTGKSTHTELWKRVYGGRVSMINDDKPALRCEGGHWYAYGTPWSGKSEKNMNVRVPIGGICVLVRSETNEIEPFRGAEAVFALLSQTLRPASGEARGQLLSIISGLVKNVPIWRLKCTPTPEAAMLSGSRMSEETRRRFE